MRVFCFCFWCFDILMWYLNRCHNPSSWKKNPSLKTENGTRNPKRKQKFRVTIEFESEKKSRKKWRWQRQRQQRCEFRHSILFFLSFLLVAYLHLYTRSHSQHKIHSISVVQQSKCCRIFFLGSFEWSPQHYKYCQLNSSIRRTHKHMIWFYQVWDRERWRWQ